jgi:ribonuclease D
VGFSTPHCVFLFDIYTLGDAALDNGPCDILQSETIEKVIHDCHFVAHYLHHKKQVILCSVYDTQVAELMLTQLQCGRVPRCPRSLPQCLKSYLNIPGHLIYCPEILEGNMVLEWNKRPLPMELEIGALKNSVFLLQLWEKIRKVLSRLFSHDVDLF